MVKVEMEIRTRRKADRSTKKCQLPIIKSKNIIIIIITNNDNIILLLHKREGLNYTAIYQTTRHLEKNEMEVKWVVFLFNIHLMPHR